MKKVLLILGFGLMIFIISCGPSAKQIEEKRIADSIRVADSLAMVSAEQQRINDSALKVIEEKCIADSIKNCCKTKKTK